MIDSVPNADDMDSAVIVVKVDEEKPEARKSEQPLLPENDIKKKRGGRKSAHTRLTNQLRKAVENHRMGAIQLKRVQVAAWRDELLRIYGEVKTLHQEYIGSIPDLTEQQQQAGEKWEVQFDTDHEKVMKFAIKYATSSSKSTSSVGTSASNITTSVLSRRGATQMLTGSSPPVSFTEFETQRQLMKLEIKLEEANVRMQTSATSTAEMLNKGLKHVGEQLTQFLESSKATSSEIAANTQLVRDSRRTMDGLDKKIDEVSREQNAKIESLQADTSLVKISLRSLQDRVEEQENRITDRLRTERSPTRQNTEVQAPRASIEAIVNHRRGLVVTNAFATEPQRLRASESSSCSHSIAEEHALPGRQSANDNVGTPSGGGYGRSRSYNFKILPFDGNPKNYARFKAKFRALY